METKVLPNEPLLDTVSQILSEGSHVTIRTKGNSMLPFIKGDMDSVELEKKETVETGDIVLAKLGDGQYILHRVVGLVGDEVTLMGDGNIAGREHCRLNDVKGCVVRILHQNGTGTECTDKRYLRRVRMWKILLPFRRYILAIYKRVI